MLRVWGHPQRPLPGVGGRAKRQRSQFGRGIPPQFWILKCLKMVRIEIRIVAAQPGQRLDRSTIGAESGRVRGRTRAYASPVVVAWAFREAGLREQTSAPYWCYQARMIHSSAYQPKYTRRPRNSGASTRAFASCSRIWVGSFPRCRHVSTGK